MTGKNGADCISVMLNPTLIDTLPPGTTENTNAAMSTETPENIMLQLRYLKANIERPDSSIQDSTGGVLPLADYLVIGR